MCDLWLLSFAPSTYIPTSYTQNFLQNNLCGPRKCWSLYFPNWGGSSCCAKKVQFLYLRTEICSSFFLLCKSSGKSLFGEQASVFSSSLSRMVPGHAMCPGEKRGVAVSLFRLFPPVICHINQRGKTASDLLLLLLPQEAEGKEEQEQIHS